MGPRQVALCALLALLLALVHGSDKQFGIGDFAAQVAARAAARTHVAPSHEKTYSPEKGEPPADLRSRTDSGFGNGLASVVADGSKRKRTPYGSPIPLSSPFESRNRIRQRTESGAPTPSVVDSAIGDSKQLLVERFDSGVKDVSAHESFDEPRKPAFMRQESSGLDSDGNDDGDDDDLVSEDPFEGPVTESDGAQRLYSGTPDSLDALLGGRTTVGEVADRALSKPSSSGQWLSASPKAKTLSAYGGLRRTTALRSTRIAGDGVSDDPTCGPSDSASGWPKESIVNCCVNYAISLASSPEIMKVSNGIPKLCIQVPKSVKSALKTVKKMFAKESSDTAKEKTLAMVAQRAANVGDFKTYSERRRGDVGHMDAHISVTTGDVTLNFEAFSFVPMCEQPDNSQTRLFYCNRGICGPSLENECGKLEKDQELAYAAFAEDEATLRARMKKEKITVTSSDSEKEVVKKFLLSNGIDMDRSPCLDPTNRAEFRGACDAHWAVRKNVGVTGTMHRGLSDDESLYLTNVYSTVLPEGRFILRHGVVQSLIQRNQWAAAVRRLIGEGKAMGTRVVNLSLVGRLRPAKEERMARAMVSNFHDMRQIMAGHDEFDPDLCPLATGESEHSRVERCTGDGLLAKEQAHNMKFLHFNLQSSVGTEYSSQRIKSLDGEGTDWRDNSGDYARMLQWVMVDLQRVADERDTRGFHDVAMASMKELTEAINAIGSASVVNRAVASRVRELVLQASIRLRGLFDGSYTSAESSPSTWVSVQGVSLMLRVAAEVILPSKTTSRATEHVLLAVLFRGLRANVSLNCKSGCDRTSYVHSVHTAVGALMSQMTFHEQGVFTEAILRMDEVSKDLWRIADRGFATWTQHLDIILQRDAKLNIPSFQKCIVQLWTTVLVHMMEVGYRIVVHSTGVPGFKFSEGNFKANLHVPRLLPPWILVPTEASDTPTPMLVHTSTSSVKIVGGDRHLTEQFRSFFQDASPFRGDG